MELRSRVGLTLGERDESLVGSIVGESDGLTVGAKLGSELDERLATAINKLGEFEGTTEGSDILWARISGNMCVAMLVVWLGCYLDSPSGNHLVMA